MNAQPRCPKGFGNQLKVLGESITPLAVSAVALLLVLTWIWVLFKAFGWVDATVGGWLS